MTVKHKRLAAALVFPVLAPLALTGYKAVKRNMGTELIIPIRGYDPRDLLSGHYLIYRLHFEEEFCTAQRQDTEPVYICVKQDGKSVEAREVYSADRSDHRGCTAIIRGQCKSGRFLAGVERFYIPEQHSQLLDRIVRGWGDSAGRSRLVINVDYQGKAAVKDLLIDDKPLRKFLAERGKTRP